MSYDDFEEMHQENILWPWIDDPSTETVDDTYCDDLYDDYNDFYGEE